MTEDMVKEVLLEYLESKGRQPRRRARQSSGPDVLIEGAAIEVKGSMVVQRALLNQLAFYLHDYMLVALAMPSDAFSFSLLHKLRALELLSRKGGVERTIRLYLIAATTAGQFAVLEMDSVLLLSIKTDQITYELTKRSTEAAAPAKADMAFSIEHEVRSGLTSLVNLEGMGVSVRSAGSVDAQSKRPV